MGFCFDIVYRPTKLHGNADALSRLPIKSEKLSSVDPSSHLVINQLHEVPLQFETIAEETKRDKELKPLWKILQGSSDYPRSSKLFGVEVCEFSTFDGKYILLIVDSSSRWLEAFATSNKTSFTTLIHLRETVARFGIPKEIVTDNDPTFVSAQFEHFCSVNGVKHLKSPPFHPSSNEQCERYVGTLKLALKKMSSEGKKTTL